LTERSVFLHDIALGDAQLAFTTATASVENVRVDDLALADALDRVTARAHFARLSSPQYHACAMDGIAVAAASTVGARETAPRELLIGSQAIWVDTGDPLPPGMDAVIMIEQVDDRGDRVAIRASVAPFHHVRPIGEDVVESEAVVARARRLAPADLAALASAGLSRVDVIAKPRVAIVTTGDELVDPSTERPARGSIVDSNGVLLAAYVRQYGGEPVSFERVPDDVERLRATVRDALATCDVVVVNAGSSAGRDDYTARTFARFGRVVVHGVAIRPGHPVVLGVCSGARPIPLLGIPGYPVSAAICADLFLRPLVERLAGRDAADMRELDARLTRKIFSPLGEDEYVRAVAARVDGELVVTPLRRGAGVITSLARANVMLTVPRFTEGLAADTVVRVRALRPLASIERTLLAVGSHDVAIDLLAGELAGHRIELVSANVGSIAGLVALASGAAHLAGTHVGAGVITSLARANVMLTVPRFTEGLAADTIVRVRALRPLASIERTLLAVGSHDVAIDLLAGELAAHRIELVSANVGSIAGLVALASGAAHLAGTHVLDPETRAYNDRAVRRYGPVESVALVRFAEREQGLIVARGNPLALFTIADLAERGARYINRQRDAGTRLLFDDLLKRAGVPNAAIVGYERIEFSHLAVAALVAEGSADCGLGIRAAALALGCDFVSVAFEPYDLALRERDLADPRIARTIETIASPGLRAQIERLGGYDTQNAGLVRLVKPEPASLAT